MDPSPLGAEQAFWLFAAAWVAGSADRLDWLRDNLQALRRRLEQGRAVNLYLPSRDAVVEVRHPRRLDRWKATHFPGL